MTLMTLTLLLQAFWTLFPPPEEWTLKYEKSGVEVYTRAPADSDINEIKAIVEVEASRSTVMAVLRDISAFPEWVYQCKEARLLEAVSPTEGYYYSELAFPWPLKNRDFVAHSVVQYLPDSGVVLTEVRGMPDRIPRKKDLVRMPVLRVRWKLTPLSKGRTRVEYFLKTDPGGAIPAFLINMAIDRGPLKSMQRFQKMLERPEYREAEVEFLH